MPSEQMQNVIDLMRAMERDPSTPIEQQRANMELGTQAFPALDLEILLVDANGVPAEWVKPSQEEPGVILYLHGGAYVAGSPRTHRNLTTRLAEQTNHRVLAIDYRMAPEHPYPAAVEDAVAAYRFLLDGAASSNQIAVVGDSAGGGLTVALLVALKDAGLPQPACAIPISPWADLEGVGESWTTRADVDPLIDPDDLRRKGALYLGGADPKSPTAAPIHADLTGLPPMLIPVGDLEVLLDDSKTLAARAAANGVDVTLDVQDGMIHVWPLFAGIAPESDDAVARIVEFIDKHIAR
ncbi:MAG: alpha/beta hydrolase [Actinomycetota bacterium]